MQGRYGSDNLTRALLYIVIILLLLYAITRISIFSTLATVFIVYSYYRMFSKSISARYKENQKYLDTIAPIKSKWYKTKRNWKDRKEFKYLKCSECGQELRVPKGKGRIKVTCSRCNNKFEIKS